MARKKKSAPYTPDTLTGKYYVNPAADWGGFINIRVDDEQKAQFVAWWEAEAPHVFSALDDLMGEGMKVALSYDSENQCYICSFTGRGWETSKSRWCMTTRAGTLDEAIALALFKHFVIADGSWGEFKPDGTKKPAWG